MIVCPGQRLSFRFEKAIDHQCLAFGLRSTGASRCLSIHYVAAGVSRDANAIREVNFAAVRNAARIDRAMSRLQLHPARATMLARIAI